jgi:hypothetical protein
MSGLACQHSPLQQLQLASISKHQINVLHHPACALMKQNNHGTLLHLLSHFIERQCRQLVLLQPHTQMLCALLKLLPSIPSCR